MYPFCFFGNKIVNTSETSVSIRDLGMLRGYGIFDYLCTQNRKPFLLEKYLERFRNSAREMRLSIPVSDEEITSATHEMIRLNHPEGEAGIRLILTGGHSEDGFSIGKPTFYIMMEEMPVYPRSSFEEGTKLITCEYLRHLPHIKTTNYIPAINLQPQCEAAGATDILYKYKDLLLETTRSNFFIFRGDVLVTANRNILIGRTRNFVIGLAASLFKVEERDLAEKELAEATEAFITGTTKKITPIVAVDGKPIGSGKPGGNTRKLMQIFDEKLKLY
jgi:D-alanine transaminase/branched-chain amino acid aminotransferase